ncbi:MAG: hypothetical protein ABC585_06840 [Candidatus Methanosuratincola petrocarbonis]|nr:hypothetical protein [Candidatus Methanosuratincola sp.]
MKCKICGGEWRSDGELMEGICNRHAEAERRLKEHFKVWAERTGIEWHEYLEAIVKNERTGKLVKEAAIYLLRNEL